jgi:hypothetical protein
MQNIPTELLRRIFQDYVTIPSDVQNITRPVVRHSFTSFSNPITLTHVCRFWHAVACEDPFLWTSILIIGPSRKMLPLVDLWLQRAAHLELSLHFVERFFNRSAEELTAVSHELFKILWKRRYYWAHIDFQFEETRDHKMIGEVEELLVDPPAADDQIRVRSARLIDNRLGEINLTVPLWLNVINNPRLQTVEVGTWCLDIPPHQHLRELICTQPLDTAHALHFLHYTPRLEKFVAVIRGGPSDDTPLVPQGDLVRYHLRHLEINTVGRTSALPVFDALTCPRLEFFSAELNGGHIESLRALISLLCRSKCRLHTLKGLNVRYLSKESLYHLFSLHQVREVETLLANNADDDFCELLTLPSTHSSSSNDSKTKPLLPILQNLDLVDIEFSPLEFSNMLMSRFNSLKQIQIAGNRSIQSLLAYDRLWDFPGTISRVNQVRGADYGIHSFYGNQTIWDSRTLFSAPEKNPILKPISGEGDIGGAGNRFGRRRVWNTLNTLERAGRGCY